MSSVPGKGVHQRSSDAVDANVTRTSITNPSDPSDPSGLHMYVGEPAKAEPGMVTDQTRSVVPSASATDVDRCRKTAVAS